MKKITNNLGFAHHVVLGILVVGIISVTGARILQNTRALTPSSSKNAHTSRTTVKTYSEGAEQLKLAGGSYLAYVYKAGIVVVDADQAVSAKAQASLPAKEVGQIVDKYKGHGYWLRVCTRVVGNHSQHEGMDNTTSLQVFNPIGLQSFKNKEISEKSSYPMRVCAPWKSITNYYAQPDLRGAAQVLSNGGESYIKNISLEIAR